MTQPKSQQILRLIAVAKGCLKEEMTRRPGYTVQIMHRAEEQVGENENCFKLTLRFTNTEGEEKRVQLSWDARAQRTFGISFQDVTAGVEVEHYSEEAHCNIPAGVPPIRVPTSYLSHFFKS